MWQDFRFALRQFRKSPVFALVAVLTLALGIGANTAIFTLLDQVLLRMLPINHPEQLVRLRYEGSHSGSINYYGGDEHDYFSTPAYRELRDRNSAFSGVKPTNPRVLPSRRNIMDRPGPPVRCCTAGRRSHPRRVTSPEQHRHRILGHLLYAILGSSVTMIPA